MLKKKKDLSMFFVDIYSCFVTDTDECANNPCENNGTCVDLVNAYECICVAGFNDTNCTNSIINYSFVFESIYELQIVMDIRMQMYIVKYICSLIFNMLFTPKSRNDAKSIIVLIHQLLISY